MSAVSTSTPLLAPGDPAPVRAFDFGAASPFLLVCDHAGRAVPARLGRLGLPESRFDEHIAWDLGASALASGLARRLGAHLVAQAYSRLVIDCNRAPGEAAAVPEVSDGVDIPGNQGLSPFDVDRRITEIHRPYHDRIAAELDAKGATLLVCVHSFTPVMQGVPRPWHVGVLHGGGSPASEALLRRLREEPGLVVGDNEPYAMDGTDYTAPRHAWDRGRDVLEIEVRQDLLADEDGRARMTDLFARLLPLALGA